MSPLTDHLTELRAHDLDSRAWDLVIFLQTNGPATSREIKRARGWTAAQFTTALTYARDNLCRDMALVIPHPVPGDGYKYRVTTEFIAKDGSPAVAEGAAFSLAQIESRMRSLVRDVSIVKEHLDMRTIEGRKANYLYKHLTKILTTLSDISGPSAGRDNPDPATLHHMDAS